jgi:ribose/xylose/arabinose/galactoside ABC-type transport system permease subunit
MSSLTRFGLIILERHLIWVLLVAIALVGLTMPGFFSVRNMTNLLWSASPLGCMVLGMFFVLLTGGLDLSLESIFAAAPTVAIVLVIQTVGESVWPGMAVVLALALGAVAGLLNGVFAVKLGVNAFLVTLATLLIFRGIVIFLIPEGVYYLPPEVTWLGGARLLGTVPVAVLVWIALYVLAWTVVDRHKLGKDIYALGNNADAAYIAGIDIARARIAVFVIAGFLAAVGGVLEVGRLQSVTADMGQGDILMVFAGAILGGTSLQGGVGRVGGIFAAVLVIAMIENLMNLYGVEPSIRQIVFGFVLLSAIWLASLQGRLRLGRETTA